MSSLYAVQFSDGLIKVGRSAEPAARIESHAARVACTGLVVARSRYVSAPDATERRESWLIARCAEEASETHAREWFRGLAWESVVGWLVQAPTVDLDPVIKRPRATNGVSLAAHLKASPRGTAARLADALGVSNAIVSQWCSGAKAVSLERCAAIERLTNGNVTRRELRPDDWREHWPELAAMEAA